LVTVIKNEIQQLESQKNTILSELKSKQEERDIYAKTVPPALLTQYDVIREKRGGVAIVPMTNNSCGGCRMALTPAKANDIRKAKAMILCDSCMRILYLPVEQVTAPVTEAASSAPAPTN
jgi:predicted  nucleic acid-binding Zn-ribbon protein